MNKKESFQETIERFKNKNRERIDDSRTLSELFQEHGLTKVRLKSWPPDQWFQILGQVPFGAREFYGYFDNGYVIGYSPDQEGWLKYQQIVKK